MDKKQSVTTKIRLKIVGVGGAGGNVVAQMASARQNPNHPLHGVELLAVNTDIQALATLSNAEKMQIGTALTHGLGVGGDAELGARAAQQDVEKLAAFVQNADIVFIATGLGGGTGSGASPVLARVAREQGALVLAFVTMPFAFEGERRRQLAFTGLEQLKSQADAVICIQNDKLFKVAGETATVMDAFKRGDEIMIIGAQAVWQLLSRKGLINLDFADLRATLGSKHCEGLFSHGEGQGANKVRDALKSLLENPIFEGGDALGKAEGVLVSVLGGPDMTLADVQRAVEPITRMASRAHVIMGAAVDENYRGRLSVTVIAAANIVPRKIVQPIQTKLASTARPNESRSQQSSQPRSGTHASTQTPSPPDPVAADNVMPNQDRAAPKKTAAKPKQESFSFERVTRGRFERSEPTLYEGQDLDVPTYLRRGIRLGN